MMSVDIRKKKISIEFALLWPLYALSVKNLLIMLKLPKKYQRSIALFKSMCYCNFV